MKVSRSQCETVFSFSAGKGVSYAKVEIWGKIPKSCFLFLSGILFKLAK